MILSAYLKKGKLDVWSVIQPDWRCRISMGSLGLHNAQFAPSSRHVLVTTNLHVIFAMKWYRKPKQTQLLLMINFSIKAKNNYMVT